MDFAYVVLAARPAEAAAAVGEALSLYEAKGNIVSAADARAVRSEWQAASPA
jgi:glycine cleavage system regulatory protein